MCPGSASDRAHLDPAQRGIGFGAMQLEFSYANLLDKIADLGVGVFYRFRQL